MAAQIMSRRFAFTFWKILNERCLEPGAKATKRSEDSQTLTTTPTGSPSLEGPMSISKPLERSLKGLFYCVLYLGPGDYHRIHSPSDWKIRLRRHFAGKLFPVNDRAVRTVRNLYVVNERVILEGEWSQGLMAMAAVGATNVGSIEIAMEPELETNLPLLAQHAPPIVTTQKYGIGGEGLGVKAGDEVAVFNLGSTVVLVFEAPVIGDDSATSSLQGEQFRFLLKKGQRVKMGEAIGMW
jgi:phosphatidylserine decarboxylase